MIIGVTGHRELQRPEEEVSSKFITLMEELRPETIVCGFALGFDTIVARAAVKLDIRLWGSIPFPDQHKSWNKDQQKEYEFLLSKANYVYTANHTFANWTYHNRNHYIVNKSDVLVAWLINKSSGGTASTVEYANKKGKRVINLAEI